MPFVTVNDPRYTDVVLEESKALGNYYSRDVVTVTTDTATGNYLLGSVLFRAKAVDDSVAWNVVNAGADIATTNDYALLIGDGFSVKDEITLTNSVATQAIAITRDARVKDSAIRAIPLIAALSANEWRDLKGRLRAAGIKVEATNANI